ncbi:MAG: alkaline phosphatase family protein [Bryobacterales bacterium]|nr:alkaline phosphatase family protein [Bryobacterales bacterium]
MKLATILLLALSLLAPAQVIRRPKLVVAIAVDQFRYDYLTKFRDQYTSGFSRLLTRGAVFTNAFYIHFPTVTAIGHSTYLTGATPSISGIVGNDWYDRDEGKVVTSVSDDNAAMLGGAGRGGGKAASPRRLLVSTVGDELKLAGRGSKVVGVSVKDRSAILPSGHMADGAYWFDGSSGNFVSSTYYFADLPEWVKKFNAARPADRFLGKGWTPVNGGAAFKTLAATAGAKFYSAIEATPYANELIEKFAEAAVMGEQLGRRNTTDLLAISFSANDYVGHAVGPDDPQVRDISIRTDRLFGDLFRFLDTQVGMRNVLVVFTADHGVVPVPEVNAARNMPGGRVPGKMIADRIQSRLSEKYGPGKWIIGKIGDSQFLNDALIRERNLTMDEVSETAAQAAREVPHVFRAYSRAQLSRGDVPGDMVDRRILNGFNQRRSADVAVVLDPYYLNEGKGTSHGSPFLYDAHVPVIFMGEGIRPGRYNMKIAPNDIAPTLATILDVETPSGAVGRVLTEILVAPHPVAAKAAAR